MLWVKHIWITISSQNYLIYTSRQIFIKIRFWSIFLQKLKMIFLLQWILSWNNFFNFILLGIEITCKLGFTSIGTAWAKIDNINWSPNLYQKSPPKGIPFYFDSCREKCSINHHGFPFAFHDYNEIISNFEEVDEQKQPRFEIDSQKPILYVDAAFDFTRWTWYTGNGLLLFTIDRTSSPRVFGRRRPTLARRCWLRWWGGRIPSVVTCDR